MEKSFKPSCLLQSFVISACRSQCFILARIADIRPTKLSELSFRLERSGTEKSFSSAGDNYSFFAAEFVNEALSS